MAMTDTFAELWKAPGEHIEAHTSGSTGVPKVIRLAKSDMRLSAQATNTFFGIDSRSVLASPLSTDYIAGRMMVVRALEAGCKLVELPVSNNIALPDDVATVDLLPIVPSQISSLLAQPQYAGRIRNLLVGGAAPSADTCRALVEAGYNTWISYGMTETCSHVALARADDPMRLYRAMPGIRFDINSEDCLCIIAPAFSWGKLATRDIVELVDAHSFRWRGRADGVINSGGIKMLPEELEMLYAPALAGREYYVTSTEHPVWGQAVMLVVGRKDDGENSPDAILAQLSAAVSDHRRLPKSVRIVDTLPRTENGKIRRLPL